MLYFLDSVRWADVWIEILGSVVNEGGGEAKFLFL